MPILSSIERCGRYWEMWKGLRTWGRRAEDERETAAVRREAQARTDAYAGGLQTHVQNCEQCRRWLASFQTNKE